MTLVTELCNEDGDSFKDSTANRTATRIGNKLKERFMKYLSADTNSEDELISKSIAAYTVSFFSEATDEEASYSVCDGSDDGGIDAIYVSHTAKILIVVQSKYNKSGSATWKKAEFLNFKEACENLLSGKYERLSKKLNSRISDIDYAFDETDYKCLFIMSHTGKIGGASEILELMKDWQNELNRSACTDDISDSNSLPYQVHLFSREDIVGGLSGASRKTITIKDVQLFSYGRLDEPHTSIFGYIDGTQLKEWWESHNISLFEKNIRGLLGDTPVNQSIKNTILTEPELFWYFNNGITVLVDRISPHKRNANNNPNGLFTLENITIVNGAQTVNTIGKITDLEALKKVKVYIKVIQIDAINDLIYKITRATNYQNAVSGRDFASQEENQQRLQKEILIEGYKYKLLRSNKEDSISEDKTIDLDDALDALVCYSKRATAITTLKKGRGKFFENFTSTTYTSIFNSNVSGIKTINLVLLYRQIESVKIDLLAQKTYLQEPKKQRILSHSNRVISAILLNKFLSNKKIDTELIKIDEHAVKDAYVETLNNIINYIETNFDASIMIPRFFENKAKVEKLLSKF